MKMLLIFLKRNWLYFIGMLIGGICGYFYWLRVGCSTGYCPLKETPNYIVTWSSLLGAFIVALIKR